MEEKRKMGEENEEKGGRGEGMREGERGEELGAEDDVEG